MFFSQKRKAVRNHRPSNRTTFSRRIMLETLEDRRLLSVTLANLTASSGSWNYGQTESIIASVVDAGTPVANTEVDLVNAGAVTGSANTSPVLARARTDSSGNATLILSRLNVGSYSLVAQYMDSGTLVTSLQSTDNLPGDGLPVPVTVIPATTSTTLTSPATGTTVPFGQTVVFKAAVQVVAGGGIPDGFVTFEGSLNGGTMTPLGNAYVNWSPKIAAANTPNEGVASFVDSNLSVGTYTIVAYYQGDRIGNYAPSDTTNNTPETVTVSASATTTVVSANPNPDVVNTTVTLTATVFPGYFGPVPGTIMNLMPGSNPAGNSGGSPVMPPIFNAPTGTVQFMDNPGTGYVDLGAPQQLSYGRAQLTVPSTDGTIPAFSVGTYGIEAVYSPNVSTFTGSTSKPVNEVIVAALPPILVATTTTVTAKPQIPVNTAATLNITVNPTPPPASSVAFTTTGTVSMYELSLPSNTAGSVTGWIPLGLATLVTGTTNQWTFTTSTLTTPGPYTFEAVFSGDATYASSQGTVCVQVGRTNPPPVLTPTTTTVAPKLQEIATNSTATLNITVAPQPASSVTFSTTGTVSMFELSPPSSATGGAAGSVANWIPLGAAMPVKGTANQWTFTTSTLTTPGPYTFEAVFSGDTTYAPSQGTACVQVGATTTTVASAQPITAGAPVTFTITVTPQVASLATFSSADVVKVYDILSPPGNTLGNTAGNAPGAPTTAVPLGPVTYDGNNEWSVTATLPVGTQVIDAVFEGDTNFAPSQGSVLVQVGPAQS